MKTIKKSSTVREVQNDKKEVNSFLRVSYEIL